MCVVQYGTMDRIISQFYVVNSQIIHPCLDPLVFSSFICVCLCMCFPPSPAKKITEVKLSALKQNQQAMQFLQMQQQQLQAIQQQVQGASSPWNIGAAYRLPDSNINLSLGYQQGRANVVLSCVPDEAVPLLGPNGFVNGVTPGNIGLSFNINI